MEIDAETTASRVESIARRLESVFGDGAEELAADVAEALAEGYDEFSAAHVLSVAKEFAENPSLEHNRPGWAHRSPLTRAAFDWLVLYSATGRPANSPT